MNTYYVAGLPFSDQNALSHGRTKGSRNGYSTTPGYVPIGQKAGTGQKSYTSTSKSSPFKTYSQGSDFAGSMVNTSTKRGKKKTGGKNRHKGEGRTYETDARGNEIHYGSTKISRGAINRASKKIKNFRSKQSAVGTAFASESASSMVSGGRRLHGGRTGFRMDARYAELWRRLGARGIPAMQREKDRLTREAKAFSQRINPHKTMSSVEKNVRIVGQKVSGFISKHGRTAVAAITAVARSVKNLLGGLFGKKKK